MAPAGNQNALGRDTFAGYRATVGGPIRHRRSSRSSPLAIPLSISPIAMREQDGHHSRYTFTKRADPQRARYVNFDAFGVPDYLRNYDSDEFEPVDDNLDQNQDRGAFQEQSRRNVPQDQANHQLNPGPQHGSDITRPTSRGNPPPAAVQEPSWKPTQNNRAASEAAMEHARTPSGRDRPRGQNRTGDPQMRAGPGSPWASASNRSDYSYKGTHFSYLSEVTPLNSRCYQQRSTAGNPARSPVPEASPQPPTQAGGALNATKTGPPRGQLSVENPVLGSAAETPESMDTNPGVTNSSRVSTVELSFNEKLYADVTRHMQKFLERSVGTIATLTTKISQASERLDAETNETKAAALANMIDDCTKAVGALQQVCYRHMNLSLGASQG